MMCTMHGSVFCRDYEHMNIMLTNSMKVRGRIFVQVVVLLVL